MIWRRSGIMFSPYRPSRKCRYYFRTEPSHIIFSIKIVGFLSLVSWEASKKQNLVAILRLHIQMYRILNSIPEFEEVTEVFVYFKKRLNKLEDNVRIHSNCIFLSTKIHTAGRTMEINNHWNNGEINCISVHTFIE